MFSKLVYRKELPEIKNSEVLYNRSKGLIPSHTQTLAKGPTQYVNGVAPKYLIRGRGCHVWDVDGNEFIDYTMGVGPLILGYCYESVDNAIVNQLKDGITFSLMHPLEVETAELIRDIIPNAECVRFSKTGADVTSAAVRLSRAYTGKNKILCCGYHGWHDWYISTTPRSAGIPDSVKQLTATFTYNDIDSVVSNIDDNTAAIILEPVTFYEPENNFLHKLREICDKHNIVLIFDEMWTGFRLHLKGAQEYFGVNADLACFSKAVANGMPVSLLTGKSEIMNLLENDVFFYTTFGGEALSLAAVKATINEITQKNVCEYISTAGRKLKNGINHILKSLEIDYIKCIGYDFRTVLDINHTSANILHIKSLIQQEFIRYGILWSGFHNLSFSHSDYDIEYTLDVYADVMTFVKDAVSKGNIMKYIYGEPVQPVFRMVSNINTKNKKIA